MNSAQVYGGRYRAVRALARGGIAEVHLAMDLILNLPVAIKVLHPSISTENSSVQRFRREAVTVASLAHRNIVAVYDFGQEGDAYFIVMEYMDGKTLREVIQHEGRLNAQRAASIAVDIAAGLQYAHTAGVIHRDLKPENVMWASATVKVVDFGIAQLADSVTPSIADIGRPGRAAGPDYPDSLTQRGLIMGTPAYFSPEQAQGRQVDARSDVYSLGIVLYEMVTGRPPFVGIHGALIATQHVTDTPKSPTSYVPDLPAAFESIILRAMAKDPGRRYQTASDLQDDLMQCATG